MKIGFEIGLTDGILEELSKKDIEKFPLLGNYGKEVLENFFDFSFPGVALFCAIRNVCSDEERKSFLVCTVLLQAIGKISEEIFAKTKKRQEKINNQESPFFWEPSFFVDYNIGSFQIPLDDESTEQILEAYRAIIKAHVQSFFTTANRWQRIEENEKNRATVARMGIPVRERGPLDILTPVSCCDGGCSHDGGCYSCKKMGIPAQ